jgi:DNA-binding GntR family transcriptional regulator
MSTTQAVQNGFRREGYLGIANRLRQQIAGGELRPGVQLPPIAELSARSCATPVTVRRALRHLEEEGLIRVEHGVGTFVADWAAGHDLLPSFSANLQAQDQQAETSVLAREWPVICAYAARALGQPSDQSHLVRLVRLRKTAGKPIALQHSYLPEAQQSLVEGYCPEHSLYEWLREATGRLPLSANETLRCVSLPKEKAALLECDTGSPAWHSIRLTTDANGAPLLYDEAWMPGDRVDLTLIKAPGHSAATLTLRSE